MKCSNRRAAIEVASSTVVLMIVGIIILVTSLGLTYKVVCGAEEIRQEVDAQTQQRIERLMGNSGTVFVADNTKTAKIHGSVICGSSRKRIATFDVGVRNTGDAAIDLRFNVGLDSGSGVDPNLIHVQKLDRIPVPPGEVYVASVIFSVDNKIDVPQLLYEIEALDGGSSLGSQLLYIQLE